MDTNALKRFAQNARRQLLAQVSTRMQQVLTTDSAILREHESAINSLKSEIAKRSKAAVIQEAAYTWFNCLCAFRYMDVNGYTPAGIVSPAAGFTQPEILQHAKEGIFEPGWQLDRNRVMGLLNRSISSPDGDQEAYRLLLVAASNHYAREMDFLFDSIHDFTELLMPGDLLSAHSVLQSAREVLTEETCQDVEVIGWLYQFYISEKKDEVMAQKGAVASGDIPAVTQLFTPEWIVRYMVQNSLGRLWLLNHPQSKIKAQMDYYIEPAQPESDYLVVDSPEELKVLDPACGSGHILTYAFDLLYTIYEEQGYDPISIPRLILEKNLYGIEIDKRAAQLAAFALVMKARQKDARFFSRNVQPNVLELEDIHFENDEVKNWMQVLGKDLWTQTLWEGMRQFEKAKTFGSLIRPVIRNTDAIRQRIQERDVKDELFLSHTTRKMLKVLEMSDYLSPRYQVVVANPPYMGANKFESALKLFANSKFSLSKADLFAMFIERGFELIESNGYNAMVTMQSWMFLSSYEAMREALFEKATIITMVHMANMVMGIAFGTAATVWKKAMDKSYKGSFSFVDYSDLDETNKPYEFPVQNEKLSNTSAQEFKKIPGSPIAYWIPNEFRNVFDNSHKLIKYAKVVKGLDTCNNEQFLRFWYELSKDKIGISQEQIRKWFFYAKGGGFRRWYGNLEYVVNWENDGHELKNYRNADGSLKSRPQNISYYFQEGLTFSSISSFKISLRQLRNSIFGGGGSGLFSEHNESLFAYLNSNVITYILEILNPTLNFLVGDVLRIPVTSSVIHSECFVEELVDVSKLDWDSYETSFDFLKTPLMKDANLHLNQLLSNKYLQLRSEWQLLTDETQRLEEENNHVFIGAYGLRDELSPEVPLEEITLTCNPYYRYKGKLTDAEREARLLEDTMKEFISYAVGCMFGRYSLDKPGLILANQGESLKDYLKQIPEPMFMPSESNVIPILDGDWFADDIHARFRDFLEITFGEKNFDENLRFIETALGKDLRRYFLRDFYKDHLQTYKKRPIYWLFSSPRGNFNALIYMHRYQPETVGIVLNQYLREYCQKLEAQREYQESIAGMAGHSARERSAATREAERLLAVLAELRDYEDQVLFPLAGKRLEIDLDDGVVVNYAKFGKALQKI